MEVAVRMATSEDVKAASTMTRASATLVLDRCSLESDQPKRRVGETRALSDAGERPERDRGGDCKLERDSVGDNEDVGFILLLVSLPQGLSKSFLNMDQQCYPIK